MLSFEKIKENIAELEQIEELDQGGQKIVFKAVHHRYGPVALKILINPAASERTQREIEITTNYK